jgi:hypothetical protein
MNDAKRINTSPSGFSRRAFLKSLYERHRFIEAA